MRDSMRAPVGGNCSREAFVRPIVQIAVAALVLALGACGARRPAGRREVAVLVLDSPVNMAFVEGRVAGLRAEDITHGSLVGRVVRSYCRAAIVSVPVSTLEGGADRRAYMNGLREAARFARAHPDTQSIVNVSLGRTEPSEVERALIRRLLDAGAVVVAAAGNDDSQQPIYPAAYEGVVAVANAGPEGKSLASNYGRHIDICASGDITFIDYEFLPYEVLRREMEARGTSFAAPRVAATLAYLLRQGPALSAAEGMALLRRTAQPVGDPLYRDGLLGVGLLDVRSAKSAVRPLYGFVHLLLPVSVWVGLGVGCLYLILRHGLVGLFLSLMAWMVALPVSILLIIELTQLLEFVGGDSLVKVLAVTPVFVVSVILAAAVQRWQFAKGAVTVVPPALVFAAALALGAVPAWRELRWAAVAGAVGVLGAVALEWRTRRLLSRLKRAEVTARRASHIYYACWDPRLDEAAVEALGLIGGPEAAEYLLQTWRHRDRMTNALARIARTDPSAVVEAVESRAPLDQYEHQRLLQSLRLLDPASLEELRQVAAEGGTVAEMVERLAPGRGDPAGDLSE